MKILTFLLTAFLVYTPMSYANTLTSSFFGHISDVLIGEIDPFYIGDACLIEVETEDKKIVGLLTNYEECIANEDELFRGRRLAIVFEDNQKISDLSQVQILNSISSAAEFYQVDFGSIENGLEDNPPIDKLLEVFALVVETPRHLSRK